MPRTKEATEKQEQFARSYFELGNATQAYRETYDVKPDAQPGWIRQEASKLLNNPHVTRILEELQKKADEHSVFTRKKALDELEEARKAALKAGQNAAAISATNSKIKMHGYHERPLRVEHSGPDGGDIQVSDASARELIASRIAGIADKLSKGEDSK